MRSPDGEVEYGVVRDFPFASARQCQSVVVRRPDGDRFTVFCKGSPERVAAMAQPDSLPADFRRTLESYTERGYRVIALAVRHLDPKLKYLRVKDLERDEVERELRFLGLIVMENRLKAETTPVIGQLRKANVRVIMVTGDNVNTAISVAKECGIAPSGRLIVVTASGVGVSEDGRPPKLRYRLADVVAPFAIEADGKKNGGAAAVDVERTCSFAVEGSTFEALRRHYPDVLRRVAVRGAVFARMSPEQKQQLVELLQQLGYYVGMCGDGANDCGALKTAHAGISINCDTESSVASPFTSLEPNIACVPQLVREGRCALVTSFGMFKYMAAYSLTQFTSVLILYSIESNLTDLQFLYIDLFLITTFAFFFGLTEADEGPLAPRPPMKSLISLTPIMSILLQLVVIIAFQTGSFFYVQEQSWFVPFDYENPTYNGTELADYYEQSGVDDSEVHKKYSVHTYETCLKELVNKSKYCRWLASRTTPCLRCPPSSTSFWRTPSPSHVPTASSSTRTTRSSPPFYSSRPLPFSSFSTRPSE